MNRSFFACLSILFASPCLGQQVIVKPGETLSSIADTNNISIRSLMDHNKIYDADKLEAGQKIYLPLETITKDSGIIFQHTVSNGEYLSSIANKYKTTPEKILSLNNLDNADYIYPGQKLNLPAQSMNNETKVVFKHTVSNGEHLSSIANKYKTTPEKILSLNNLDNADYIYPGQKLNLPNKQISSSQNLEGKNKDFHTVAEGDNLTSISRQYDISIETIMEYNNLRNPSVILPGTKLALNSNKDDSDMTKEKEDINTHIWKNYGPLKVNWSNWKSMRGSYVTPAINKKSKPLFLAIDCSSSKINATGAKGQWKDWFTPIQEFEFRLLEDLCKEKNIYI